jgi:hypothetical protein
METLIATVYFAGTDGEPESGSETVLIKRSQSLRDGISDYCNWGGRKEEKFLTTFFFCESHENQKSFS